MQIQKPTHNSTEMAAQILVQMPVFQNTVDANRSSPRQASLQGLGTYSVLGRRIRLAFDELAFELDAFGLNW